MNVIKRSCLTILNLGERAVLPQAAAVAFQHRRRLTAKNQFEVEPLERIRNPSQCLGRS